MNVIVCILALLLVIGVAVCAVLISGASSDAKHNMYMSGHIEIKDKKNGRIYNYKSEN